MVNYEVKARKELASWKLDMMKKSPLINRLSKRAQTKINQIIPTKIHVLMTESIKKMVEATLIGSNITTNKKMSTDSSLELIEDKVRIKLNTYKRTAAIEGAGTGAGGIFLGIADFPLLLSIKMKFLFDTATLYGFDINEYKERVYILYIFQLAFSSDDHRRNIFRTVENWDQNLENIDDIDWRLFQQEYRDYIDLVKLFQLLPGIGAVVGAYANYHLLDHLGETAMYAYRMRLLL
ncbi:EcsC family protein [Bacillus sp. Marseille-P3661]|uniref:EcsC family protein n=1 Tax=Bacillus sp. Marseille-P3661 TaxID=1936234 RepID=UPI000C8556CD|nr:EcsC family protein [Bacillus sp. Marseille-P3661]